jgi:translation initiation factor IF-2
MVTGKKGTRLSKVARELNVGITTLVEYLQKQGVEISSNPNTKIDDVTHDTLERQFKKDHDARIEADRVNLRSSRSKQDSISIEENEETKSQDATEKPVAETVKVKERKTVHFEKKQPKKDISKPEKVVIPESEKPKIKIVGQVDLKKSKSPSAEKPTDIQQKKSEPAKTEKVKSTKPAKASEDKTEKKKENIAGKTEGKPKATIAKEDVPPKKATPKVKRQEEIPSDKKKEAPAKAEPVAKARPDDKTVEVDKSGTQNGDEIFKLNRKKLSGPTVVGKIELPVVEKKKPGEKNNERGTARKKKRKRIQKKPNERVQIDKKDAQRPKEQKDRRKRPQKRRVPIKKEIREVDVQKQIKETLARLTSKGQKSKGSKYRREKRQAVSDKIAEETAQAQKEKNVLKVTEFVSVNELATMMDVPSTQVIATCMSLGLLVSINQRLDAETMSLVADEFSYDVEFISVEVQEAIHEEEDSEEELKERPPIVTVMGHVDHGKTSLLDHIRKANVIAGEAGGITQHIGAYNVSLEDGRKISFLDTPGHEAFTAMRARGAQVTDIAIIIVAADDNVMPQTIEAINHASAAGVPIVFAINKVDKPNANPEQIKRELADMNYLVEEWGGKYQSQDISAKDGLGVDELLEKVLLESEMLELKANPDKRASGSVIESSLDKGKGYVATILVQAGTLRIGDVILAGQYFGHVKAMFNERNQPIKEVGPSEPVLILGLNGAPQAGDKFNVMENERESRQIANKREQLQREQGLRTQKHITLDEIGRRIAIGNFQELNVIVKGDVDGSIEALSDSLIKLSTEEIQVNVIHKAVGQITESDVMLANASNAIIIGFQVRPSLGARKMAEKEQIDIRLYSIIYDAINEIKAAMEGMLSPEIKEEITGSAEIMETFKITKVGTIAGCIVRDGKINRNSKIRLIREGIVTYTGDLGSLKRFKEDVKEVAKGYECGLNINGYNDIKVGDIVETFVEVEVAKKLK